MLPHTYFSDTTLLLPSSMFQSHIVQLAQLLLHTTFSLHELPLQSILKKLINYSSDHNYHPEEKLTKQPSTKYNATTAGGPPTSRSLTYHAIRPRSPRTQRVGRIMVWDVILRWGLHLSCPWPFHAVG